MMLHHVRREHGDGGRRRDIRQARQEAEVLGFVAEIDLVRIVGGKLRNIVVIDVGHAGGEEVVKRWCWCLE